MDATGEEVQPHQTVASIMNRRPPMIAATATVEEAAKTMARGDADSCLVKSRGKIVGIITERDIVRRVVAKGLSPSETRVREVMTTPITIVAPTMTVEEAARVMAERGIRRLPVVEGGTLLGLVTITELAQALSREAQRAEATLAGLLLQAISRRPPDIYG